MSRLASRPASGLHCALWIFTLSALGSGGCVNTRAGRPDAEVARAVAAEDLRQARLTAVAAVDLAPFELASAGSSLDAMALLYVPARRQGARPAGPAEPAGAAEGWHYYPPTAWEGLSWPLSTAADWNWSLESNLSESSAGDAGTVLRDEGGGGGGPREGGGGKKPKVRLNLLKMKIKDRPVSFSGSLKGFKGVQLKATIKL